MRACHVCIVASLLVPSLMLSTSAAQSPFQAFQVSSTPRPERFPKTDGRFVVWTDVNTGGGSNDVFAYDLLLGQRIPIDGNFVVWHDSRNSPPHEIWGRKLDQPVGSDFAISNINTTYPQVFPDVSGSVVVWMTQNENGDQGNIYGRDVNGGGIFPVTTDPAAQSFPKISGRTVVWNDTRDGTVHVYGRNLDLGGDFLVSSAVSSQYLVSIDGDLVVWRDDRTGVSDIWGRYLSGGGEFQITDTSDVWEDYPEVYGDVVVWEQSTGDGFNTDIWAAHVPEPTVGCFSSLAFGIVLSRRRR
jgi:beta propeller repeat protein